MQQAVVVFRIPQALLDALDNAALTRNIGRSDAFREAISTYTATPNITRHGNIRYPTTTERTRARKTQVARNVQVHRERKQNANAQVANNPRSD